VFGHIAVQNPPPVMRNDEEAIEHAEGERRYGEEIHRRDGLTMVAQKCRPPLCRLRTPWRFPHPTQHGSFGNTKAEHFQLAMNTRRTPSSVLRYHAKNEITQFLADTFPSHANPMARKPLPVQLEPRPVPADNGLWLHKDQRLLPSRPEPQQHYPKQFVRYGETRLRVLFA
jgi:hypothetical protein